MTAGRIRRPGLKRKGRSYPVVIACVLFLGPLFDPSPGRAADPEYVSQLQKRARQERLAERPEWRALLHYRPELVGGGVESQVDAPSFFLSSQGKRDPRAELDATLAALFAEEGTDPDQSAQCTFIGRYHWLKETLEFDPERLPELPCRRFHRWLEQLQPYRLALIFPSAYLNNPASMFGHTLLRIDTPDQDEQTRLLAYTINYAAQNDEQGGMRFAFKGLFGMYQGRFSISPYYLKVKVYGDIENRDIWEFGLNLSEEEIGRMLRHLWEMRSAWFDYWFVDENCSYHLLSLLETARPGLGLVDRFPLWAIPSETVRAVAEAGLLRQVRFRPARNTVILARARQMDEGMQELAGRLTSGGLEPDAEAIGRLPPTDRAQVIELALDYAAYRQNPRFEGAEQDAGTVSALLKARSRIDVPDQTPDLKPPEVWPGKGHKPARAGIGYGVEENRQFVEVTAGPGYHELFDPPGGFTPGAQVTGLQPTLRYYPEEGRGELERFDLLDLMSLSPWNYFLRPVSWKAGLGLVRKRPDDSDSLLVGRVNAGYGLSRDFSPRTSAHAFAEGTLELSDRFEDFVSPGVGPGLGVVHDVSRRWRAGLFPQLRYYFWQESRWDFEVMARNRLDLDGQSIVGFDLWWRQEFDHSFGGGRVYWRVYF